MGRQLTWVRVGVRAWAWVRVRVRVRARVTASRAKRQMRCEPCARPWP